LRNSPARSRTIYAFDFSSETEHSGHLGNSAQTTNLSFSAQGAKKERYEILEPVLSYLCSPALIL
jgi:hypothetical protein